MSVDVLPVSNDDVPAIARSLAKAFHDDPVFSVLFGGSVPLAPATRFFEIMTNLQMRHHLVYRTAGSEAAAIWAPPDLWKTPVAAIVKNAPALIRVFGRRLFANLAILTTLEKHHPSEPHYYLEFLGTAPEHQGNGFGGALLTPMLQRCDDEGVGAYLESSKESNLAFYGRFGFEVTDVITHKAGVQQWLMWRKPR
ncbi:MAG: GNAT family N-acetyltransferase [Ilumatobacteraceae bacterium]